MSLSHKSSKLHILKNLHGLELKQRHYFRCFSPPNSQYFTGKLGQNTANTIKIWFAFLCTWLQQTAFGTQDFIPLNTLINTQAQNINSRQNSRGKQKICQKIPSPQCGFQQNLGSTTSFRWASCTELEFAHNRKKKFPLRNVEMWDRGGNGPGAEKRLPLSYLCTFGWGIKYMHRNLALFA